MAGNREAIDDMLKRAKRKKTSKAFDRSSRIYGAPLTDEAKDWAENNAGKKTRDEINAKLNPIQQSKLKKISPITSREKYYPVHNKEVEPMLNSNSEEDYNIKTNMITARNKFRKYNKKGR